MDKQGLLFGWYEDNPELTARLLAFLAEQGVKVIGYAGGCVVVRAGYVWWTLCDNGGEINVEKVNDAVRPVSIPTYGYVRPALTVETVGAWVLAVIRGQPIDWRLHIEGRALYDAAALWGEDATAGAAIDRR